MFIAHYERSGIYARGNTLEEALVNLQDEEFNNGNSDTLSIKNVEFFKAEAVDVVLSTAPKKPVAAKPAAKKAAPKK